VVPAFAVAVDFAGAGAGLAGAGLDGVAGFWPDSETAATDTSARTPASVHSDTKIRWRIEHEHNIAGADGQCIASHARGIDISTCLVFI
jgi:hypothetical protein